MNQRIFTYRDIEELPDWYLSNVVLTCGVWDCLHIGHLAHLEFCGSWPYTNVVVCVGNDATVRMLKGHSRPIVGQADRARMVAALECVDAVVVSEEYGRMNFTRLMELLKPARLVVPIDDPALAEKRALCEQMGVELVVCDLRHEQSPTHGVSTTAMVTQVLERC